MKELLDLLSNRALWACLVSWAAAQGSKVLICRLVDKKWDWKRFFGLGGMPSSHSSVVCTIAMSAGIMRGFGSLEFAMMLILALVVMTDASGVRREAGQHARILNRILDDMKQNDNALSHDTLKELLGHSPFEVLVGALLGVLVAFAVM
ncbi:MAG: divergent PAP2 family protein [Eubacteriales bacterium]|nr:divergent PAP2 family protein [Eubacteriales bacterium]